ncbi:TonB-linked SusC/RagA family outer membrane protein [Saonia flava]|uniref:TonB-linked SusC/RagA family outer membrane protein n=1 Tax=Saonia flava TaxID=523696 RepID=A0A846R0X6_9FLAO|nr:TonB-dependent receptor [Saonia flava]NJB72810.1 TonB-linked SusC/RagA family outer membrane protein [Saonia flava]
MRNFKIKNSCRGVKHCYLLLLFCFVGQSIWAQNQVSGVVNDSNGTPLPGVNIVEKGTSNGVVSDFDGNYNISAPSNATLVFSYLGFQTSEIAVNGRSTLNVSLTEDTQQLDEVVVIGYGSQLKEDISGAVASVNTEALETIPQVSVDQMIQGRAAGVSVTTNSGRPGSSVSVRIRGVNTISGSSEPLYIIDGVPVSGDGGGGVSPLASINPNDIESVDILKDASATAIYGSRGSNGVVLITTKKGKKNDKGTLSYNSYIAVQQPTNIIDVMNLQEYAVLQNEINEIYGLQENLAFLRPELLGEGTNWQKEIFDTALLESHQVSFAGNKEGTNFYLSAGILNQDGTVIASDFKRATVRANVDSRLNDWLDVGLTLTASRTKQNVTLNGNSGGLIGLSLLNNPATAVYNPDGTFAGPTNDDFRNQNPIANALSLKNEQTNNRLLGNIFVNFKLGNNLSFRTEFGGDFGFGLTDQFTPTYQYGDDGIDVNTARVTRTNNDFWIIKNLLTYQNNFNDQHNVTVLLGQESQEAKYGGITASDGAFVGNEVPILGTGDADDNVSQFKGSNSLSSYFGRLIYSLNDKYNLTASFRADGSSRFAEGNKWGYFPSASVSWKLFKEDFMDGSPIENLRIYGGYGEVGNQNIPNFAYGARLTPAATGLGTGFLVANFANPDLTWESSTQTNLGLDFTILDSRLKTTVEVYNKVSKDFLFQFAATDFITGGSSVGAIQAPWVNLGEMVNKGIDVNIGYRTLGNTDFSWESNLTVSHYKNKVTQLNEVPQIFGTMNVNYDGEQNISITREGQPIGLFYGYEAEGLFRTLDDIQGAPVQFDLPFEDNLFAATWLGDVKYKDQNNDGVIDENDLTVIGNPHPDFTFGWQNTFGYKNWDLAVFVQGSYGNDAFNAIGRLLTAGNRTYTNQLPEILDFWSIDNPDATYPRFSRNDTRNLEISDRYVEDASYLRIQNVTLGYSLPGELMDKIGISRVKLYGSIQNLYTFTKYSGYDPEIGVFQQTPTLMGIDAGRYPSPRTFTLGVNIDL